MFCQSYEWKLKEAAAGGEALSSPLAEHLMRCDGCAEALAAETALYAAIDGALSETMNTEVPAALLPRVRAASKEAAHSAFAGWVPVMVSACSIALIAAAIGWPKPDRGRVGGIEKRVSTASNVVAARENAEPEVPVTPRTVKARIARSPVRFETARTAAEVLVPDDERVALQSFLAGSGAKRPRVRVVLTENPAAGNDRLEISSSEVSRLEIKALTEVSTEISSGATR
jgi:hypothetical protein